MSQMDSRAAATNQRSGGIKIDAKLVKMMQQIETMARKKLERYKDMLGTFKDNKEFK